MTKYLGYVLGLICNCIAVKSPCLPFPNVPMFTPCCLRANTELPRPPKITKLPKIRVMTTERREKIYNDLISIEFESKLFPDPTLLQSQLSVLHTKTIRANEYENFLREKLNYYIIEMVKVYMEKKAFIEKSDNPDLTDLNQSYDENIEKIKAVCKKLGFTKSIQIIPSNPIQEIDHSKVTIYVRSTESILSKIFNRQAPANGAPDDEEHSSDEEE